MDKNLEQSRVETLIPQQLVGDSLILIDFLKEYYEFLNTEGNPSDAISTILENKDLDSALDKFILLIRKEIGEGLNSKFLTEKRNLYKHINQLYRTKGTLDSIALLFRILFGVDIEIKLPKEQMLIASDGRWTQETSLFVKPTNAGDPYSLVGNTIDVILPNITNDIIKVAATRSTELTSTLFEIKIEREYVGNIIIGSTVAFGDFTGEIIDTASVSKMLHPGSNFRIGQFIDIEHADSTVVNRVKVASVDANGGITSISYIKYGIEYPDPFIASLSPKGYDANIIPGLNGGGVIYDIVKPIEYGFIVLNNDAPIQFGDKLRQSRNTSIGVDVTQSSDYVNEIISNPARAFIEFNNRTVTRYKGTYPNTKGFLSDNMFLQDKYYQDYSYVIQSELELEEYESILKKTVHPAGMQLYGEINITTEVSLFYEAVISMERYFNERAMDVVDTFDDTLYDFNKHMVGEIINTSDRGSITTNPETFYALDYFITPVDEYGEPTDRAGSYTDIYDFRIIRF